MTDGELADEHRGQSFAKFRAESRIAEIEAELKSRGTKEARGRVAVVTRHHSDLGLVDLPRLREEQRDLCREYATPGTNVYFRSKMLTAGDRS